MAHLNPSDSANPSVETQIVWLIGMMASGKTSVAKILGLHTESEIVNMDDVIEDSAGKTIPEIFAEKGGNDRFRILEKNLVISLSINPQWRKQIISTGGGAPCFHENIDRMIHSGLVVYLRWTPETLARRTILQDVKTGENLRPLLADMDLEARVRKIQELLEGREPIYSKAHMTIDTDNHEPCDIAGMIINRE